MIFFNNKETVFKFPYLYCDDVIINTMIATITSGYSYYVFIGFIIIRDEFGELISENNLASPLIFLNGEYKIKKSKSYRYRSMSGASRFYGFNDDIIKIFMIKKAIKELDDDVYKRMTTLSDVSFKPLVKSNGKSLSITGIDFEKTLFKDLGDLTINSGFKINLISEEVKLADKDDNDGNAIVNDELLVLKRLMEITKDATECDYIFNYNYKIINVVEITDVNSDNSLIQAYTYLSSIDRKLRCKKLRTVFDYKINLLLLKSKNETNKERCLLLFSIFITFLFVILQKFLN